MKKLTALLGLALSLVLTTDCPGPAAPDISFPGFTRSTEDIYDGFMLTFNFAETPVGTPRTIQFPITNAGTGPLIITDITYYRQEGSGSTATYTDRQSLFGHSAQRVPSFPITIQPQTTYSNLFPVFAPETCGLVRGILAMSTNMGTIRVRLTGTGQWRLTLTVNAGQYGSIVRPIAVAAGQTLEYLTAAPTVTLESTPSSWLYGLQQWVVVGAATAVLTDASANLTTVTLTGHATVRADFIQIYLCVDDNGGAGTGTPGNPYNTIQAAIAAFTYPTHKGIVVAAGTYTPNTNLVLPQGTFWGGYNGMPNFDARNITTYVSTINLGSAYEIQSGANSVEGTDMNGFTINGGTLSGAKDTAVRCSSGSKLLISRNIITAPVEGYAIYAQDSTPSITYNTLNGNTAAGTAAVVALDKSSSLIDHNTITAGNATLRSIGLFCFNESSPAITNNTITAGNSTAADGESAGIYIDWFCGPAITGNTIAAGASAGSGGASYGIYNINSCSPVVTGNTINGGSGAASAFAFYNSYSGRPVINDNTLITTAGSARYGLYSGSNGRFASLKRNNIYECPTAFVWIYIGGQMLASIDEVNEQYVSDEDDFNISQP